MKLIDNDKLDTLTQSAKASPRKRMNLNLHETPQDTVQRLCNAIEPDTYIRPHRHVNPDTMEVFLLLRGSAVVLLFDETGQVRERIEVAAVGPTIAMEIPAGAWHAMASLESGTVFFEVKKGPYVRPVPDSFASWAPEEGSGRAKNAVDWYRTARPGDRFSLNE